MVAASSDEMAQQLAEALQKFAQPLSGQNANKSKFGKLLKQVNVDRDGDQVSLDVKIDRETFVDFLNQSMSDIKKKSQPTGQKPNKIE